MKNMYTKQGWINAERLFNSPASIVIAIGGRGIGKTYGCLSYILDNDIPFIYMRRTQSQIDTVSIPALNPFNAVCLDKGITVTCKKGSKYSAVFSRTEGEEQRDIGLGIALSTFANIRGISASHQLLLFDEFIPEKHERPITEEGAAFLNVLESLNRNRELNGQKPMKIILLSNSNSIFSPILESLGCVSAIDRMIKKGRDQMFLYNGNLEVIRYLDSPISKKKRNTLLYQVANNDDFLSMSLDNDFSAADFEHVKTLPLQEFNPMVNIGKVTVYYHKSQNLYYVLDKTVKLPRQYEATPLEVKEFRKNYFFLYEAMIKGRLYYANVKGKMYFENLWKVK